MYDQRVTIAEAVEEIQRENYLLPAIQREIVWKRDQITDLFDSVLQGYPIGTFLYWDIEDENRDQYKMYGFIQNYITTTKYINTDSQTRNSEVIPDGSGDLKLVLDGQQRLSSFYVGLKGTYTYKQPYKWYRNESAWSKSRLYLNITSDPNEELDEGGDRNTRYEFSFLPVSDYDKRIVSRGDDLWFRAGAILNYSKQEDLDNFVFEMQSEYVDTENTGRRKNVGSNLRALWRAIHDKSYVTYFEEKEQDIDRVLEIFIRTNDGGTQLQKSDLLLSIATANWTEYDAREELTSFVDHLNTQLPSTNNYGKDFLLKSCLVLSDLSVRYRVGQFNRENVSKIEDEWPAIKEAIETAATLVNQFGIDENTLTSRNAVIPIAYYFKQTGVTVDQLKRDQEKYHRIKQDIKKWFVACLLNGTFSGNADTVLRTVRDILSQSEGKEFPLETINEEIANLGKVVGFNEEIADNVLEYEKGSKRTFLALSLLYPGNDWGSVQYHQDHIFPQNLLGEGSLRERGFSEEEVQWFTTERDKLANLQLLTEGENTSKQDTPFEEWVTGQARPFYKRHFIPQNPELHELDNFDEFVMERRELIKQHLLSVLSARSQPEDVDT
ncbi:GmrSD restriction endonuclease domain-containing protein [Halomarina rubra]|uniref:DUF262 domain-containing protein n=1 Tax=Halomarina rubra TaxID=2071873 RepID=A0ABD6AVY1_9EURY|nr:DUF262 domain-containing protein [Halomarina rubra]